MNNDASVQMSFPAICGTLGERKVDLESVEYGSLRRWTLRCRGDDLIAELSSIPTGEVTELRNPSRQDVLGLSARAAQELDDLCSMVGKQLRLTDEEALESSGSFVRKSDLCWAARKGRRVVVLTRTTKREWEAMQKEDRERSSLPPPDKQRLDNTGMGLPGILAGLMGSHETAPADDFKCWGSMYADDRGTVISWHRTPRQCLVELYQSYQYADKEGEEFVSALADEVPITMESKLKEVLLECISLRRLLEEECRLPT